MSQSLLDAAPTVIEAITTSITLPREQLRINDFRAAMRCLQAWIPILRGKLVMIRVYALFFLYWLLLVNNSELTSLVPLLVDLLPPTITPMHPEGVFDEGIFVPASVALQEIMSKSSLSGGGAGARSLTDPLLSWMDVWGSRILESNIKCMLFLHHPELFLYLVVISWLDRRCITFLLQTIGCSWGSLKLLPCVQHHVNSIRHRSACQSSKN